MAGRRAAIEPGGASDYSSAVAIDRAPWIGRQRIELDGMKDHKLVQADVLAINWRTKDVLLGGCRWERGRTGRKVIQMLIEKTDKVVPSSGEWTVQYAFFSRRGFTAAAEQLAAKHHALLASLDQIEKDIQRWMSGDQRK